jgi:hypothetical protein
MIANDFGLVAQGVFGLALGYEDLNDHDELRSDPVLGALLGKLDGAAEAPAALTGSRVACRPPTELASAAHASRGGEPQGRPRSHLGRPRSYSARTASAIALSGLP